VHLLPSTQQLDIFAALLRDPLSHLESPNLPLDALTAHADPMDLADAEDDATDVRDAHVRAVEAELDAILEADDDDIVDGDAIDDDAQSPEETEVADAEAEYHADLDALAEHTGSAATRVPAEDTWGATGTLRPNGDATWMTTAIVQWRTGDERALLPLIEHYQRVFRRDAKVMSARSGRERPLDPGDIESAGMEHLVKALDGFATDAGIPFPGFFKQFRRAALREERAAYIGPMRLSRRTMTERGAVFRALESVRAEQLQAPDAARRVFADRFVLPSEFTSVHAHALSDPTSAGHSGAVRLLRHALEQHLVGAVPGLTTDVRERLAAVVVVAARTDGQRWPDTPASLEAALAVPLSALLTRIAERGPVAGTVGRATFRVSAAFTDTTAVQLAGADRGPRLTALFQLFDEVDAFLARTVPGADDATRRTMTAARLGDLAATPWPQTARGVEGILAARLSAFLERVSRLGAAAARHAVVDDSALVRAVAAKAGISEKQVRVHLRLDLHGTSLDAPVEGKGGKEAGSIGDRIGTPDRTREGDLLRASALIVMPLLPLGARAVFALSTGLDGGRACSQDEIALGLGLPTRTMELFVQTIAATLKHPDVVRHLKGEDAARVAADAESRTLFLDVRAAYLRGEHLVPDPVAPADRARGEARVRAAPPAGAAPIPQQEMFA